MTEHKACESLVHEAPRNRYKGVGQHASEHRAKAASTSRGVSPTVTDAAICYARHVDALGVGGDPNPRVGANNLSTRIGDPRGEGCRRHRSRSRVCRRRRARRVRVCDLCEKTAASTISPPSSARWTCAMNETGRSPLRLAKGAEQEGYRPAPRQGGVGVQAVTGEAPDRAGGSREDRGGDPRVGRGEGGGGLRVYVDESERHSVPSLSHSPTRAGGRAEVRLHLGTFSTEVDAAVAFAKHCGGESLTELSGGQRSLLALSLILALLLFKPAPIYIRRTRWTGRRSTPRRRRRAG